MKKSVVLIYPNVSQTNYFQPYAQNLGWNLTCFDSVDKAIPYIATHKLHDVIVDKRYLGDHVYDMDRLVLSAGNKCKLYFYSSGLPQRVKKNDNVVYLQKELDLNVIAKHFVCPIRFLEEGAFREAIACPLIGSSPESKALKELIAKASHYYKPLLLKGAGGVGKRYFSKSLHCQNSPIDDFISMTPQSAISNFESASSILKQPVYKRKTIYIPDVDQLSVEERMRLSKCIFHHKNFFINHHRFILTAAENFFDVEFEDFFNQKMNGEILFLKPLKSRPKDLYDQIVYFSYKFKEDESQLKLDENVLNILMNHDWPGNTKELKSVIAKLYLDFCNDDFTIEDLQVKLKSKNRFSGGTVACENISTLEQIEVQYIQHVLNQMNGNISRAANVLEITRNTLKDKLRKSKMQSVE